MIESISNGETALPFDALLTPEGPLAESIRDFCRGHGIRKLSLFGSYARGQQKPESDLDLLVEFHPGRTPDLLQMVAMEMELAELTGHRVDLRTIREISRYVRSRVLSEAKALVV